MAVRCARCGILSPERSLRCDCGYDFVTGEIGPAHASIQGARVAANRSLKRGGIMIAGSLSFTVMMGWLALVSGSLIPIAIGALALAVGVVGGALGIALGIHGRRRLPSVHARPALPAARVIAD